MKHCPTKFVVRENTASPRQHASRLTVDFLASLSETLPRDSQHGQPAPVLASRASEESQSATPKPQHASRGGAAESSTEVLSAPTTLSADNASRQTFEPFISCEDAANV